MDWDTKYKGIFRDALYGKYESLKESINRGFDVNYKVNNDIRIYIYM